MEKEVAVTTAVFTYKFAIYKQDGTFQAYEKGIDRIADLNMLQDQI